MGQCSCYTNEILTAEQKLANKFKHLSKERVDIIKSLGADVLLISKEEGGFIGSIKLAE